MGNPHQGEVTFEANGKNYTFKLGTYALAVLERTTQMPYGKFFKREESDWGADDILRVFYAGLFRQHKLTEEEVGDLIDIIGSERASEIILEAIGVSNPKEVATGTAHPQRAEANGVGMKS